MLIIDISQDILIDFRLNEYAFLKPSLGYTFCIWYRPSLLLFHFLSIFWITYKLMVFYRPIFRLGTTSQRLQVFAICSQDCWQYVFSQMFYILKILFHFSSKFLRAVNQPTLFHHMLLDCSWKVCIIYCVMLYCNLLVSLFLRTG